MVSPGFSLTSDCCRRQLFLKDGTTDEFAFIDWQMLAAGAPGSELVQVLSSCYTRLDDYDQLDEVVADFHAKLIEASPDWVAKEYTLEMCAYAPAPTAGLPARSLSLCRCLVLSEPARALLGCLCTGRWRTFACRPSCSSSASSANSPPVRGHLPNQQGRRPPAVGLGGGVVSAGDAVHEAAGLRGEGGAACGAGGGGRAARVTWCCPQEIE